MPPLCEFCGRCHPLPCLEAMACAFSQTDLDFFVLEAMWNAPASRAPGEAPG